VDGRRSAGSIRWVSGLVGCMVVFCGVMFGVVDM
jgi:hypothetical protein